MQFTYPLYDGEKEIGCIKLNRDSLRLHLQAECSAIEGIQRAWVISGDESLLIGVLMPEGNKMQAKKTYTLGSLGNFDPGGITHGELRTPHQCSPWRRCTEPQSLFSDGAAQNSLDPSFEYRIKTDENKKVLAVPWKGGKFPMPGLFCLCSVKCINGRQMVVIRVDEAGLPCI